MSRLLTLAAWLPSALAALPYIPTTALTATTNSSLVYVFQPGSDLKSATLITVNASSTVTPNSPVTTLSSSFPFLGDENTAFNPFIDANGNVYVLSGQCSQGTNNTSLWSLKAGQDQEKGNWASINVKADGFDSQNPADTGGVNFLASSFLFSNPVNNTPTLYSFGGMCPNSSVSTFSVSDWQESANYSNTLFSLAPQGLLSSSSFASIATKDDQFDLSPVTSSRGPPIAEAGFSVTGLTPLIDGPNDTNIQQNLVLIGGHTADAFINMSQFAMLSLPEQSWSFFPISASQQSSNELSRRQSSPNVEPRSGHTAVLSEDGKQIVVLGGWVGDVNTPAEPQLAILEVGIGFGGTGDWQWTVPDANGSGFSGNGIYAHGATMLPGNVMMIVGGTTIMGQGSKTKRDAMGIHFFNVTSKSWSTSYQNPTAEKTTSTSNHANSPGLHTGQKVGLGVGIGVGIPLFFLILAIVFCLRIRKKRKDKRRSDLIDRAINGSDTMAGRYSQSFQDSPRSMAERPGSSAFAPSQPGHSRENSEGQDSGWRNARSIEAERTGLLVEIPSPTRGLRRGHIRGNSSTSNVESRVVSAPISVIDEMDEEEPATKAVVPAPFLLPELDLGKSFTGTKSPSPRPPQDQGDTRPLSDPFADPVAPLVGHFNSTQTSPVNTPHESHERESRGWIEDWEVVQAQMQEQREKRPSIHSSPQHLSHHRVSPVSQRASHHNSDRTESNISERSMHSAASFITNKTGRSSNPSVNRNTSQRSANLFSVLPNRVQRKPVKAPRTSLPQAGTVSTAVAAIERTPPGTASASGNSRSLALSPGRQTGSPGQPRMPSFGTLQAESHALLGSPPGVMAGPRSGATPATHLGHTSNIEGHSYTDFVDPDEDDEFPQRPIQQRRSRGIVGSVRNVLGGRGRTRLSTTAGSVSSLGSPTTATFSSGSPTRASTATPFSMLRAGGGTSAMGGDFSIVPPAAAVTEMTSAGAFPAQSRHEGGGDGMSAVTRRPGRTASVGSAPWRHRQSGARDWDWMAGTMERPQTGNSTQGLLSPQHAFETYGSGGDDEQQRRRAQFQRYQQNRRSSPGVMTTDSMGGDDVSTGRSDAGADWDVESAVERRCVQVMFTVPRERLRVVNASEGEADTASTGTIEGEAGVLSQDQPYPQSQSQSHPHRHSQEQEQYEDRNEHHFHLRGGGGDDFLESPYETSPYETTPDMFEHDDDGDYDNHDNNGRRGNMSTYFAPQDQPPAQFPAPLSPNTKQRNLMQKSYHTAYDDQDEHEETARATATTTSTTKAEGYPGTTRPGHDDFHGDFHSGIYRDIPSPGQMASSLKRSGARSGRFSPGRGSPGLW